jgi:signal transduction histidine kinase
LSLLFDMHTETHSNELLEAILQGIGAGIIVIDENGKCLLSNAAATELLSQLDLKNLNLTTNGEFSGFYYADKETPLTDFDSPFAKAMGGELVEKEEIFVRNAQYPFGAWFSYNIRPLQIREGKASGGVIIIEDITDRRKLADEVARSNRDLQQFAYVAAHDLQEPLRTVTGFGELLAKNIDETDNEKAKDHLRRIIAASKRMQTLIAALLSYARIETRAKAPEICNTQLIVQDVVADLHDSVKKSEAELDIGELPDVMADSSQLSQVFRNLISNSLKYRKESPRIEIRATTDRHYHHFWVKDNGIGIDPRFADRVFVIFQRLHNKSQYEGVGIGLSLCKKIIENHGGKIWIQSPTNHGTEIHFTLPVVAKGGKS